ncbi:cytochrome P450 [Oceanicoccus sagamiensis]|nr:cytochrome P450 [Oceanicoccus sagamiensis]
MTAPTMKDNRALADMPLFDNDTLKCPYHFDKTLREDAPVFQDPTSGVWIVATYDLVREAHKAPEVFSNDFALALGSDEKLDDDVVEAMSRTYDLGKGTLLTVDDPVHNTYRDELKSFFLAKNVAQYRPWIEELADKLVAGLPYGESFEFVEGFTRPLPLSVIMHVLGMPLEMRDLAFKWTVDNVTVLSQVADKPTLLAALDGLKDEYDWFANALEERRNNPRDDLINLVAHATYEGRPLTIEEQLSHCTQFMVAGNETTTATLAEGMRQLCLNPEQQQMIREDRSLIPALVEESLRVASPTSNMWRVTKSDYTIGGVTIPANSMVLLKYFSSNHDESMFEEPLEFDVKRSNAKRHIAFGFGSHVCIGQHLSKLEMIIAWEKLFDNSSNFKMVTEPQDVEYMPSILLRGIENLNIIIER